MQTVTVYRNDDPYESWVVEMIDPGDDGTCEKAVFYGAESERQARDWATQEYSSERACRHDQDTLEPFLSKEYRESYLDGHVKGKIACQIHAIRKALGLSKQEFGELIGKSENVVSRLEETEYGAVNVNTLLKIANRLKVSLRVQFIGSEALIVESIEDSYRESGDKPWLHKRSAERLP